MATTELTTTADSPELPSLTSIAANEKLSKSVIRGHDLTIKDLHEIKSLNVVDTVWQTANEEYVKTYKKQQSIEKEYILTLNQIVPVSYKQRYVALGASYINYFLQESRSIPGIIDEYISLETRLRSYRYMHANLISIASIIEDFITRQFNIFPLKQSLQELYFAYSSHIKLDPLAYFALTPSTMLEETRRYNRNLINPKNNDFRSIFVGSEFTLSNIRSGDSGKTLSENTNLMADLIDEIYKNENIYKLIKAERLNIPKAEAELSWSKNDILPSGLGGSLKSTKEETEGMPAAYTRKTFKPHKMYRNVLDNTGVVANTYDRHIELARMGYIHK